MNDAETLLGRFATGSLIRPAAGVPNLVDLVRALASLAGVADLEATPGALALAELIGPAEHLIFVLADGLGQAMLDELAPAACLPHHQVATLRTVFPSTSATVLTTLATGAWPNQHGVTGQWTHLPAIGATADLLRFAARTGGHPLTRLGISVEQVFPLPTLMERIPRPTLALLPETLVNSVSAIYFSGGRPRCAYRTLAHATEAVLATIERASEPTYTYLYTPWVDLEAHRHGVHHHGVRAVIAELDRAITRLAERLRGRARIVLTADHGLLDTPVVARHWIRPSSELAATLHFPPSGDSRVMYLHARPAAVEELRRHFRERYGERFFVLSTDEVEALELLGPGPLEAATRQRLGELVIISAGEDVIEYVPSGSIDRLLSVIAHHSGLAPGEMLVPLIVI